MKDLPGLYNGSLGYHDDGKMISDTLVDAAKQAGQVKRKGDYEGHDLGEGSSWGQVHHKSHLQSHF